MTSTRPYLIRAFYEWIVDNNCTPYVVIDAEKPGVKVPQDYIEEGKIVLNISMVAVRNLSIANDSITFDAKFSGIPTKVNAPIVSVLAIYANENGRGMIFTEEHEDEGEAEPPGSPTKPPRGKPHLKIVK